MLQVSESRVCEVLDAIAADPSEPTRLDMARGATHFALRLGLISITEYRRRCDALIEAKYGPEAKEQA